MTQSQTILDTARRDAQDLHKKISANIAKAGTATWDDVKAVQADAVALAAKMKTLAQDQADAAQAGIKAAIAKLDEGTKLVEDKAVAAKDDVKRANAAMLESAHKAAQSLSQAVADLRSKAAKAIEPKKVTV